MKQGSLKSLIRNRDFVLMQFGFSTSRIGSFMQIVAVNWQLYQMTKSPVSLGILGIATFTAIFICSFISGLVADIFDRKKIIFLVQIFSIISASLLAYLTISGHITPLLIYLLVGFDAGLYSFESPARQAMMPTIISRKDYPLAVNIGSILMQLTNFVGPALSGFIIAFYGVKTVYLINAASFLAVIIALIYMSPLIKPVQIPKFNLWEIKNGVKFVFKTPLIRSSMLLDFFATFFGSAMTLMPIFAVEILKVGPTGMGFLYAAPSIGAVIAGLIFPLLSHFKEKGKMIVMAVIFYGLATLLFAISKIYWLSLIFIALAGAGDMISAVLRNIIRQLNTPNHLRGRMTAVNMVFYSGGPQLGEIEAGFAAKYLGTSFSVALGGLFTIIVTLIVVKKNPQLIRYLDVD